MLRKVVAVIGGLVAGWLALLLFGQLFGFLGYDTQAGAVAVIAIGLLFSAVVSQIINNKKTARSHRTSTHVRKISAFLVAFVMALGCLAIPRTVLATEAEYAPSTYDETDQAQDRASDGNPTEEDPYVQHEAETPSDASTENEAGDNPSDNPEHELPTDPEGDSLIGDITDALSGGDSGNETGEDSGNETGEDSGNETGGDSGNETGGDSGNETGGDSGNETDITSLAVPVAVDLNLTPIGSDANVIQVTTPLRNFDVNELNDIRLSVSMPNSMANGNNWQGKYYYSTNLNFDMQNSGTAFGYFMSDGGLSIPLYNYNANERYASDDRYLTGGVYFLFIWAEKTTGSKQLDGFNVYEIHIVVPDREPPRLDDISGSYGFIAEEYNIMKKQGKWVDATYDEGERIQFSMEIDLASDKIEKGDYGSFFLLNIKMSDEAGIDRVSITVNNREEALLPDADGWYRPYIVSNNRGRQPGEKERYDVTVTASDLNGNEDVVFQKTIWLWNDKPVIKKCWLTASGELYAVSGLMFFSGQLSVWVDADDPTSTEAGSLIYDVCILPQMIDPSDAHSEYIAPMLKGNINPTDIVNACTGYVYVRVRDCMNNHSEWKLVMHITNDQIGPQISFREHREYITAKHVTVTVTDLGAGLSPETPDILIKRNGEELPLSGLETGRNMADEERMLDITFRIPLLDGENNIEIEASDLLGNTSSANRQYVRIKTDTDQNQDLVFLSGGLSILGEFIYGSELTVDTREIMLYKDGTETAYTGPFLYGWRRDGFMIDGAEGPNYVIGMEDIGHRISATVSAAEYAGAVDSLFSPAVDKGVQAAPVITYTRSGNWEKGGVTVNLLTPTEENAVFSLDGETWSDERSIRLETGIQNIRLFAQLTETETRHASPIISEEVDFSKKNRPAPESAMLYVYPNEKDGVYGTYSVHIIAQAAETAALEFSFDNISFSEAYEGKFLPGITIKGYVRYAADEDYNASGVVESEAYYLMPFRTTPFPADQDGVNKADKVIKSTEKSAEPDDEAPDFAAEDTAVETPVVETVLNDTESPETNTEVEDVEQPGGEPAVDPASTSQPGSGLIETSASTPQSNPSDFDGNPQGLSNPGVSVTTDSGVTDETIPVTLVTYPPEAALFLMTSGTATNNNIVGDGAYIQAVIKPHNEGKTLTTTFIVMLDGVRQYNEELDSANRWYPSVSGKYNVTLRVKEGDMTNGEAVALEFTFDIDPPMLSYKNVDEKTIFTLEDIYSEITYAEVQVQYSPEPVAAADRNTLTVVDRFSLSDFNREHAKKYTAERYYTQTGYYYVRYSCLDACNNSDTDDLLIRIGVAQTLGDTNQAQNMLRGAFEESDAQTIDKLFKTMGTVVNDDGEEQQVVGSINISAEKMRETLNALLADTGVVISRISTMVESDGRYDRFSGPINQPGSYAVHILVYDNSSEPLYSTGDEGIRLVILA